MSVKTEGFENGYEALVSVATSATLAAKTTMGWDNTAGKYKPSPTVVTVTTTLASSDNVSLATATSAIDYGSVMLSVTSPVTGSDAKVAVNYSTKVITISSHAAATDVVVTYNMYDYEPSAILSESVSKGTAQSKPYAKALLNGVVADSDLYGTMSDDLKARLAKSGIIVLEREEVK